MVIKTKPSAITPGLLLLNQKGAKLLFRLKKVNTIHKKPTIL
jgi:hypothetical protein